MRTLPARGQDLAKLRRDSASIFRMIDEIPQRGSQAPPQTGTEIGYTYINLEVPDQLGIG